MFVGLAAILYVIAAGMIIIGGFITADGSQIFPAERAVAQYIAGLGMVTGGAILLGIASLIVCLGILNRTMKKAQDVASVPARPLQPPMVATAAPFMAAPSVAAPQISSIPGLTGRVEPAGFGEISAASSSEENTLDLFEDGSGAVSLQAQSPEEAKRIEQINAELDAVLLSRQEPEEESADQPEFQSAIADSDEDEGRFKESAFGFYSYSSKQPTVEEPVFVAELQNDVPVAEIAAAEIVTPEIEEARDEEARQEEARQEAAKKEEAAAAEEVVEQAPQVMEAAVEAEKPAVGVVGSYESGGNRYVMYSDGSIEAHLPTGIRVFSSLEELKRSVNAVNAA